MRSIANGTSPSSTGPDAEKDIQSAKGRRYSIDDRTSEIFNGRTGGYKVERDIQGEDVTIDIDKPAGMVVHPAPGHSNGTLLNALLYHCGCPAFSRQEGRRFQKV